MEKKQKINCTVSSCKYNNNDEKSCKLEQIIVTPVSNCNTKKKDESMCGSYENNQIKNRGSKKETAEKIRILEII